MSDSSGDQRGAGLSRLLDGAGRLVDRLPGGSVLTRGARSVESTALGLLKERMDRLDSAGSTPRLGVRPANAGDTVTLQQLLDRALDQNRDDALRALCARILAQLTPDEARVLSALADGTRYPLIHVMSTPRVGGGTRRLLDNVSNVGKKAGIQLADRARYYVAHLRALELAETGSEDESLLTDYQLLETDTTVRDVLKHVESKGGAMRTRIVRRTLMASAFGKEFWRACNGA